MPFFGIFISLESFFIRSLVRRSVEKLGYTFLFLLLLLYSRFKKGERDKKARRENGKMIKWSKFERFVREVLLRATRSYFLSSWEI